MYEPTDVESTGSAAEETIAALTEKIRNLEFALESNRRIGMAIGILMASELITEQAALDVMREASQNDKLKLSAIAEDVLLTGAMPTTTTRREHQIAVTSNSSD
jgi:AmiR/NasT family two-component response regulator